MSARPNPLALCLPALAIGGLLLLTPFAMAFWRSLTPTGAFDLAAYRALGDSVFLAVVGRTLGFATLVTLGCLLLGLPCAYALLRAPGLVQRVLLAAISLSFLVGTLIRSYAWLAILGAHGLVNSLLHLAGLAHPLKLAFTFGTMVLASVQVELPLFILPLYGVMRGIDRRLSLAAQSLGADPLTAWLTAFLPLALPGLAVSGALVFLTALGFFTIPALLGPPDTYLLSQALEVQLNTLGDSAGASARIVVMLALVTSGAALAAWGHGRLQAARGGAHKALPVWLERAARALSPLRWWLAGGAVALAAVLLILPLAMLVPLGFSDDVYLRFPPRGFSLRWLRAFAQDPDLLGSTAFSLEIALGAALLSTGAGAVAALARGSLSAPARRLVDVVVCAPLVVSPITVTAALYMLALRWSGIDPAALFVAVYAVMGLPYGYLLVGAGPIRVLASVTLPILRPAALSALAFAVLMSFDDISAGLFLASSERMPLALRLWEDLKAAITPLPAAITLLAAALVLAVQALWRVARSLAGRYRAWRIARAVERAA